MKIDVSSTLEFAENIAIRAGKLLLKHQAQAQIVAYKDRQDFVTTADLKAQKLIVNAIRQHYPTHSIFSEEQRSDKKRSIHHWIIDPLDGTKEYYRGIPLWNTNLTLEINGIPTLSVIYKPSEKCVMLGIISKGSFGNGIRKVPSPINDINKAHIYAYIPSHLSPQSTKTWHHLKSLSQASYRLRGSAEEAVSISWVGLGKIEAAVNTSRFPHWYDFVSGFVMAQSSHCTVSDLNGKPITCDGEYKGYIVSNGHIHQSIINAINN